MKKLILACLIGLPAFALADAPPKGPDFDAHSPSHGVDSSLAASSGDKAILPTDDVVFLNDSAALNDEAIVAIANTSAWMKRHPKHKLVLEGHASIVGTKGHNEDLATARASAVRLQLIRTGVAADRVIMVIYGEVGAQKSVNPNDRRVIMFASMQPTQVIVVQSLRHEGALSAAWTKNNILNLEKPIPAVSKR